MKLIYSDVYIDFGHNDKGLYWSNMQLAMSTFRIQMEVAMKVK